MPCGAGTMPVGIHALHRRRAAAPSREAGAAGAGRPAGRQELHALRRRH